MKEAYRRLGLQLPVERFLGNPEVVEALLAAEENAGDAACRLVRDRERFNQRGSTTLAQWARLGTPKRVLYRVE